MRLILKEFDWDIIASQEEKYELVIGVASAVVKYDQILDWINTHLTK